MVDLRDYQAEAIAALYDWFGGQRGNPLVVAPTGAGKSVILAEFVRGAVADYPGTRVLIVTHVKELIAQNFAALLRLWPGAPAGIYSAGLGRKQIRPITVGGVQSLARVSREIGWVDLIVVDEAHLIPRKTETQYGRLIEALREINPAIKIVGLTATPYRLDSGRLDRGSGAIFDGVAYDIPVRMLVERGFLAPLVSKRPAAVFDTSGLKVRGGEFVEGDMDARFNRSDVIEPAVDEISTLGADRRSWLAFCCSVDHALAVRDAIRARGVSCETVTGKTPAMERDRLLRAYKAGEIRCLTSVAVLTTGFDAPQTDLIAMLRPTQSTGLYVQIAGRGMRIADGKDDCLVLDFAGNVMRHGPVDAISALDDDREKGEGKVEPGEAPAKACPSCGEIVLIATRECACGYEWPAPEPKHEASASTEAIMVLTARDEWQYVQDFGLARHRKAGSPDSLRVEYLVGGNVVREWVCVEHSGFAREKAVRWWAKHAGTAPPETVGEAMARAGEVRRPVAVVLARDGKYHRVKRERFDWPEEWPAREAAE